MVDLNFITLWRIRYILNRNVAMHLLTKIITFGLTIGFVSYFQSPVYFNWLIWSSYWDLSLMTLVSNSWFEFYSFILNQIFYERKCGHISAYQNKNILPKNWICVVFSITILVELADLEFFLRFVPNDVGFL